MDSIISFLKQYSYLVAVAVILILWVVFFWYMLAVEKRVKKMENDSSP